jgi:arylsulfatase A-like enzyme
MVESVDTEIGRLLAAVDRATTTVIVVGDNGTPDEWNGAFNKSKGTDYRLGLEVPLIFWGDAVDSSGQWGLEDAGHVSVVDLYRTLLRLLPGSGDQGMQVLPLDSVSLYESGAFASARPWNFAERFKPLGAPPGGPYAVLHRAVEDAGGYKLIERETGARELYDTAVDPDEEHDLLADGIDAGEQAILDSLEAILSGLGL